MPRLALSGKRWTETQTHTDVQLYKLKMWKIIWPASIDQFAFVFACLFYVINMLHEYLPHGASTFKSFITLKKAWAKVKVTELLYNIHSSLSFINHVNIICTHLFPHYLLNMYGMCRHWALTCFSINFSVLVGASYSYLVL